jgi:sugar phosphate isomerase/epimerase
LFGTAGFNLFGPAEVRDAMFRHLAAVCRIGAGLGAPRLVFGSPKNRDRGGLSDADTMDIAVPFFRRMGDVAADLGVTVCLEPNPAAYGANFMTCSSTTAAVVRAIDHPAIRMQLDTGALAMNGENPAAVLAAHAGLIGHVHASEPHLVPLGEGGTDHAAVRAALEAHLPEQVVSIEMLATRSEPHLGAMARALAVANRHYRAATG